jgi:hypothetical protein
MEYTDNTAIMELHNVQRRSHLNLGAVDIQDAEVFYPSRINEIKEVEPKSVQPLLVSNIISTNNTTYVHKPFIEANTLQVDLSHLKSDCIIPVFSKDNEKTIAHQEFIDIVMNTVLKLFPHHSISNPEIRVSHQIKGRTPDAIYKSAKDLLDHEKTIYYERMAFIIQIPSIVDTINGNELALTLGGVRSYNLENLYNKKTFEKFKFFIGFQNKVCCNLCVSSDGFVEEMRVGNYHELQEKVTNVIQNYSAESHLEVMRSLSHNHLTEHQFAQLLGKSRLYQHLPKKQKLAIPSLNFNDSQLNTVAKDYYEDESFCRSEDGDINLWSVYNLFTQANKSSYIDTFLDRNLNAFEFSKGIQKTLNYSSDYSWFLS